MVYMMDPHCHDQEFSLSNYHLSIKSKYAQIIPESSNHQMLYFHLKVRGVEEKEEKGMEVKEKDKKSI